MQIVTMSGASFCPGTRRCGGVGFMREVANGLHEAPALAPRFDSQKKGRGLTPNPGPLMPKQLNGTPSQLNVHSSRSILDV